MLNLRKRYAEDGREFPLDRQVNDASGFKKLKDVRFVNGCGGDSDDEDDAGADDTESTFIIAGKAVELVRDSLTETRAPENVERAVWSRVAEYDPCPSIQPLHANGFPSAIQVHLVTICIPPEHIFP